MTDSQVAPAASAASPTRASSGAMAGVPPSTLKSKTWMPRCTVDLLWSDMADRRSLSALEVKEAICRRAPPAAARRQIEKVSVGGESRLDERELAGECLEPGPTGDGLVLGEEDDLQLADQSWQQLEEQRHDGGLELVERLVQQHRRAAARAVGGGGELRHDALGERHGVVVGQGGGARRQRPERSDVLAEPGRGLDLGAVVDRPVHVGVTGERAPGAGGVAAT